MKEEKTRIKDIELLKVESEIDKLMIDPRKIEAVLMTGGWDGKSLRIEIHTNRRNMIILNFKSQVKTIEAYEKLRMVLKLI